MELGGDGECEESRRRDRLEIIAKLATVLEVEPAELLRVPPRPDCLSWLGARWLHTWRMAASRRCDILPPAD